MSIRYKKVQNKIENSLGYNKWYARAVSMGTVSTEALAEELSHSTTVTRADIMAVLTELAVALRRHLLDSQKVELDGLGSFRVGLQCKSAADEKSLDAGNIKGYRIVYRPETKFVATGTNAKGHRTGVFTKTLLQGVSAELMPEGKASGTSGSTTTSGSGN